MWSVDPLAAHVKGVSYGGRRRPRRSPVSLLGGPTFMASDEVGHLAACTNGLALHPPSRSRMTGPPAACLDEAPLTVA
ncbi:hypothetical protein [Streptomyces sp. NBC_00459]|uniref:hypothetical protein n=1 Tax=Streptomyces sp. NBC_00459 TaxID=2975749 RepID=UPI003FA6DF33